MRIEKTSRAENAIIELFIVVNLLSATFELAQICVFKSLRLLVELFNSSLNCLALEYFFEICLKKIFDSGSSTESFGSIHIKAKNIDAKRLNDPKIERISKQLL